MKYLEIGPGNCPVDPSWDLLDIEPRSGIDIVAALGDGQLPIGKDTYDLVYASHVIEHIAWFRVAHALLEVHRILKPRGVFEVWVPDFARIVDAYRAGRCGDNWRKHNPQGNPWLWLNGRVFAYGPEPNWHRAAFDAPSLRCRLEEAGFIDIERLQKPRGYHHGPVSLGMRGRKPCTGFPIRNSTVTWSPFRPGFRRTWSVSSVLPAVG